MATSQQAIQVQDAWYTLQLASFRHNAIQPYTNIPPCSLYPDKIAVSSENTIGKTKAQQVLHCNAYLRELEGQELAQRFSSQSYAALEQLDGVFCARTVTK